MPPYTEGGKRAPLVFQLSLFCNVIGAQHRSEGCRAVTGPGVALGTPDARQ